jgi:UDP-3-O-[3-hydroxymyristoyl] N-acetylglucosamine deacetylase
VRSQTTLRSPVSIEGIGLHTGQRVRATFRPAPENHGIVFFRRERPDLPIPATAASARSFDHATTLGRDGFTIGTVEHLLSAAYGLGLDNFQVELDGPEIPILDGSALPFVRLFQAAGFSRQSRPVAPYEVSQPLEVSAGDKSISIRPGRGLTICYEIEFAHRAIGRQKLTANISSGDFAARIAPARTFGFLREIEYLRQKGLARGGSLQNAVVLDDEGIISGPLRFRDEFVRHKIMDLVGDLALLGRPLEGRIHARKAGHALHAELVRALLAPAAEAWVPAGAALIRAEG